MNDLLMAMGPVVLLWSIPLFPMIYAGVVATLEAAARVVRSGGRASRVAERTVVRSPVVLQVDAVPAQELSA